MRFACWVVLLTSAAAAQMPGLYSPDPEHIWNRVHGVLHVRVADDGRAYGWDELDPLLWTGTEYLLTGDSHRQALAVLDEFLSRHAETSITDPLRRAIFQHDLWAVFDWSDNPNPRHEHSAARRALQDRLARVIRRVALSQAEIERLPDNLAEAAGAHVFPNLPADLFDGDGPWVCLCRRGIAPVASKHTSEFSGRSVFLVFLRLPGARERTLAYLKKLRDYAAPWHLERDVANAPPRIVPSPALPQFPPGTQVALVRRMMLIDRHDNVVPTRLTESVQIRVYQAVSMNAGPGVVSDNSEFLLSREKLFSHRAGGLLAVGPDDRRFSVFMTHGHDVFEMPDGFGAPAQHPARVLDTCADCHRGNGIDSVLSYTQTLGTFEGRLPEAIACRPEDQAKLIVYWKRRQHNLGLLQGLWSRSP